MWWLVTCCTLNYTSVSRKFLFNYFNSVSFIVFVASISATYSHTSINSLSSVSIEDSPTDDVLCRLCGADLGKSKDIINNLSPYSTVIVNQTLFERQGVEVQLLSNPLGIEFHTIAFSNSECDAVQSWQKSYSWYPGFAWKPCICRQCKFHHGWLFEPVKTASINHITDSNFKSDKSFYVLKLKSLLSKNCNCKFLDRCTKILSELNMVELTKEQQEFLAECEELFKDRYTDKDEEFMKIKMAEPEKPPIVDPWFGGQQRSQRQDSNRDRGRYREDRKRYRDERNRIRDEMYRDREERERYRDERNRSRDEMYRDRERLREERDRYRDSYRPYRDNRERRRDRERNKNTSTSRDQD